MNSSIKKKYSKGKTTVLWQPALCIHSEKCFHGLPSVFDPNRKPWVDMDGAEESDIIKQVHNCPSGALSIVGENEKPATEINIEISNDGPILIRGQVLLKTSDGQKQQLKNPITAFCRCGASNNKPFCDGTHKKIDFKG